MVEYGRIEQLTLGNNGCVFDNDNQANNTTVIGNTVSGNHNKSACGPFGSG